MRATVNNSSGFSIIGKPEEIKRISRKIRPFRHAYIKLIKAAGNPLTWEYADGINEFGEGFVQSFGDGTGSYSITFNTSAYKNVDNVVQESEIVHTTITTPGLPILTSAFFDNTRGVWSCSVFDVTTYTNIDIDGEILVVIKEFYD